MLLQIDVTGRDPTGGVAAATIEVEIAEPGTAPVTVTARSGWQNIPPGATMHAAATFPDPSVQADAEQVPPAPQARQARAEPRLMAAEAPAPEVQAMEQPVPGMTNSKGHKGAVPDFVPPQVTQAQRSMTLGRFTGGYR